MTMDGYLQSYNRILENLEYKTKQNLMIGESLYYLSLSLY